MEESNGQILYGDVEREGLKNKKAKEPLVEAGRLLCGG